LKAACGQLWTLFLLIDVIRDQFADRSRNRGRTSGRKKVAESRAGKAGSRFLDSNSISVAYATVLMRRDAVVVLPRRGKSLMYASIVSSTPWSSTLLVATRRRLKRQRIEGENFATGSNSVRPPLVARAADYNPQPTEDACPPPVMAGDCTC